jgi:hypothetical protein
MYSKEKEIEAKGCSLTFNAKTFLDEFEKQYLLNNNSINTNSENILKTCADKYKNDLNFYNVVYHQYDYNEKKNIFIIPGKNEESENLNLILNSLKDKLKSINFENKPHLRQWISEKLTRIAYLFKSSEYLHENEVRLIISGFGLEKCINKGTNPPRVYIELVSILPFLEKITIGPKVERAEEWAAAFYYELKKEGKDNCEIAISKLPYK